jgi:hypothetical protein
MRGLRLNGQKIAIIFAVLLMVLSAGALNRHIQLFGNPLDSKQSQDSSAPSTRPTVAKEDSAQQQDSAKDKPEEINNQQPAKTANYTYTAVLGDSYTALARDAINKYATENNMTITDEQLLVAEVQLANDAGLPMLDVGQTISIAESSLSSILPNISSAVVGDVSPDKDKEISKDFEATAETGDSYVSIAREAITQYLDITKTSLTDAQKVAAETFLAQAENWPELDKFQKVIIETSSINSAVSSAKALSAQDQEMWQQFVSA